MPKLNESDQKLLDLLAELGGKKVQEEAIEHRGTKIVLPETMTTKEAIRLLKDHLEMQETVTSFSHTFQYRPWDGAVAFQSTLRKLFGTAGLPQTIQSFFGDQPPELRSIRTGVDDSVQVPWGQFALPQLDATIFVGGEQHPELGPLFRVAVEAPRKHAAYIAGLFRAVEAELGSHSIYRGKAFDGQDMPEFIDLSRVDPSQAIYSEDVEDQLRANVWSLIEHTDTMRELGVPLKRSVLVEGPYGSGKTLSAFVTATKAVAAPEPWTFIYCRPGRDNLDSVMATARLYQPSIVFYEDVDTIASSGDDEPLTRLLDLFDGIQAKGTELMVMMTTNHVERIHKAMARPGRLDSVIHIGAQDGTGVERMIRATVDPALLDAEMDYAAIAEAMVGFMPAFVKEAIDRTTRYAIARAGGRPTVLSTEDFVKAAHGLRPQLDLMNSAGEGEKAPTLDRVVTELVGKGAGIKLDQTSLLRTDGQKVGLLSTNGH